MKPVLDGGARAHADLADRRPPSRTKPGIATVPSAVSAARLTYLALLFAFSVSAIAACAHRAGPEPTAGKAGDPIRLVVHLHLVRSDALDALGTTMTADEAAGLVLGLDHVWQPAGITWTVGSVVHEPARDTEQYRMLAGPRGISRQALLAALPAAEQHDGWHVYIVRDLGGIAGSSAASSSRPNGRTRGVYVSAPERQVIVLAESGLRDEAEPAALDSRVLAHELGHSLGLAHVPCTTVGNVMSPRCIGDGPSYLTPDQIRAARRQAQTGQPYRPGHGGHS